MPNRSEPRLNREEAVRIFGMDSRGRAINLASSTMDISKSGARLKDVRCWDRAGEVIGLRYGMEKARFKIVWVGQPGTPIDGQVGLQCVESRYIFGVTPPTSEGTRVAAGIPMPRSMGQMNAQAQAASYPDRRRRDQRFSVSGGVNIKEIGVGVPQWTMLHDISAGGCYVETTCPLLPQSHVELTLQVGEFRIECKGTVTVKHPLVGMGIRFTEISALNKERLVHLIAGLAQSNEVASKF